MRKKILTACLAAAMAVTTVLAPASTANAYTFTTKWDAPTSPVTVNSSIITTAGHRAAQTLVEILGLNNTACQNMAGNPDGITDGAGDQNDPHENGAKSEKGLYTTSLVAAQNCKILGVFGSNLNSNPDPYYYNYFYNCYAETKGGTQTADEIYCIKEGLSPNEADTAAATDKGNVSYSVARKPDILIGSSAKKSVTGLDYLAYIQQLRTGSVQTDKTGTTKVDVNASDYTDYNPIVFQYKYTSVYEEGESLQRLAETMNNISTSAGSIDTDKVNTHKGTSGRYGDPMVIANDYQLYVKGLSAYVSKKLKENNRTEKTVVVIDACSDRDANFGNDDMNAKGISSGWFRAYDNTTATGLAKMARGAECLENVTQNLLTTYKNSGDSSKVINYSTSDGNSYAISAAVVKAADVIVLQGVQSSDVMSKSEFETYMKMTYGWTDADLANKTIIDSNPDCVYGLTCNSSETALGYGYYMGYVYPEYLDPVDAIAYFYKKCLHVTDETALQKFMDLNVAKAVANLSDNSTKLSANWEATIRKDINEGVNYFSSLDANGQARFAFVSLDAAYRGSTQTGIFTKYNEQTLNTILYKSGEKTTNAVSTTKSVTYNGKAQTPAVTVTIDGAVIDPQYYTVTYANNKNAGTATVTATLKAPYTFAGTLTTTFKIAKASQKITVTKSVASRTYKYSKLKKKSYSYKINAKRTGAGKVTYKVKKYPKNAKKYISVNSKGKVTMKKRAKKGTYQITITAAATSNYNKATKVITIKVK